MITKSLYRNHCDAVLHCFSKTVHTYAQSSDEGQNRLVRLCLHLLVNQTAAESCFFVPHFLQNEPLISVLKLSGPKKYIEYSPVHCDLLKICVNMLFTGFPLVLEIRKNEKSFFQSGKNQGPNGEF